MGKNLLVIVLDTSILLCLPIACMEVTDLYRNTAESDCGSESQLLHTAQMITISAFCFTWPAQLGVSKYMQTNMKNYTQLSKSPV